MAPTIQKEAAAGRAAAAATEMTSPTRMASRQLPRETSRSVGVMRAVCVADMGRGMLRYLELRGRRAPPWRTFRHLRYSTGERMGTPSSPRPRLCPRLSQLERRGRHVTSFYQARFRKQVLLELGDIVEGRLGVLLAGDGQVELVLLLGQQFEELRHMPHVLLPIELRGPGPVPRPVGQVFGIVVHGLDGGLPAAGREL